MVAPKLTLNSENNLERWEKVIKSELFRLHPISLLGASQDFHRSDFAKAITSGRLRQRLKTMIDRAVSRSLGFAVTSSLDGFQNTTLLVTFSYCAILSI